MNVKKGKHESIYGPFKGFVMGCAAVAVLLGVGGFINGSLGGGLAFMGSGIVIAVLGSLIPNKNRITY